MPRLIVLSPSYFSFFLNEEDIRIGRQQHVDRNWHSPLLWFLPVPFSVTVCWLALPRNGSNERPRSYEFFVYPVVLLIRFDHVRIFWCPTYVDLLAAGWSAYGCCLIFPCH